MARRTRSAAMPASGAGLWAAVVSSVICLSPACARISRISVGPRGPNLSTRGAHARIWRAPGPSTGLTIRDTPLLRLSRSRFAPLLATAFFVWLGYLVLIPLRYNQLNVFEQTLRVQALIGAAVLAYLAHLAYHGRLPGPTRLDWPVLGVVGAYCLATALSIDPRFSLESAFLVGWLVLTFYIVSDLDELSPQLVVRGLAGVGIAAAFYALYRVGEDYASWLALVSAVEGGRKVSDLLPPSVPRVHDVGDHVNMIALAFNLTLPFVLVVAFDTRSRIERLVTGVGAAAIVAALFFTVSRAAWVSAAVALPVFALLYRARDRGVPVLRLPSLPRPAAIGALAVLVVLAAATAALAASRWESRPEWLFRSSLSPRYDAFDVALKIIRDEPWTGAGPNTYSLLYGVYSGKYPIEDFHPHNGYLAAGVDGGLVLVLALAALGIILLRFLYTSYLVGSPERRAWLAACTAALVALAVHSAADMPNQSKTALLLIVVVIALALKAGRRALPPARFAAVANVPRLAVLVFLPLFLAAWLWTDCGHRSYDQSLSLLLKGDFEGAAARAVTAADRDPRFAAYQLNAGVMQAVQYLVEKDRGENRPDLLADAVTSLRKAEELEPRSGIIHANLAIALMLEGDGAGAVEEARLARARSPGDGTISAVAGTIFEQAGEFGEAIAAYGDAVTHDVALMDSPFWTATQFRRESRDLILKSTFLSACQKARTVAMFRGESPYPDDLAALADACSREVATSGDVRARSDLAVALASLGRTAEALDEAQRAVDRAPDNPYARTALAIAIGFGGDMAQARHQLLLATDLGDPDAALILYYTYAAPPQSLRDNLHLTADGRTPPAEVIQRLRAALPQSAGFVYDNGIQDYLLGILYYRPRYFRESPATILIPGDWLNLRSPRTLAIQAALAQTGR
jgi:Flp pilus assembly protein TadD